MLPTNPRSFALVGAEPLEKMAAFLLAYLASFPRKISPVERHSPPPLAPPPAPSSPPTFFDAGEQPLGTAIAVSLVEDHWWHASFPTTRHPLLVSVRVQQASGCSEGAASDGTCTFGLKLFGSHFGPPRADSFEHAYEGAHHAGDEYSLRVPACAPRGASARYHIGLLGWDGTNQLVVRVDEARFLHSRAVCPRIADAEEQPLPVPMPRSSHAAALLGDVMLVFGGQLAEAPADANEPQSADTISTPATDELWAFHLPTKTWSPFAKDEGSDESEPVLASGAMAVEATAVEATAVEAEEAVAEDAAADAAAAQLPVPWPAARSGHSLTSASTTVAGTVLLFGGQVSSQSGQGELLNDVWLFNCSGCDDHGASRGGVWRQLHVTDSNTASPVEGGLTGVPSARVNHAAVAPPSAKDGALVIFGGLGRTRLPDTTVRVAEEPDSLALRLPLSRLREQSASRALPVHGRRSDEAAVAYATAQLELLSDVWRLSLSPPRWERLESRDASSGAYPARRYGASICACSSLAACGTQMPMYLFGGMSRGSGVRTSARAALRPSDELWAFTPEAGGRWEEVVRRSFGSWPEARAFHTALVRADALLMYGGVNVGGHTLSDLWIFTLPTRSWSLLRAVELTNAAPFVRRAWHTVVPTDAFSSDALVYGGLEGGLTAQVHADLIRLTPPSCSPTSPPHSELAVHQLSSACINCPAGTAALPRPPARANSTATAASQRPTDYPEDDEGASGGQCRPCPRGWLSTRPGSGACEPCPRGTFSDAYGLSSWSGCALCPEGTASSRFGASNCTPCAGSTCPAGTIVAGSTAAWPRLTPKWALSELRSDSYPEVSLSQNERELRSSRTQTTIALLGLFGFLGFGTALAAAGLFRPKAAEHLLRHADVPPISGGPGKSRVGGFFTIVYVFTYVTLAVELLLQFLFFNYQVVGFLSPTANSHLESTPSTLRVNMRLLGLAPEHCLSSAALAQLLPDGAAATAASTSYEASTLLGSTDDAKLEVHGSGCAPGLTLRSGGVEPELGGSPPQLNCSAAPDGASCDVQWECSECSMAGSQIELHLTLASRFAMAHAVSWDAAVTWSHRQPAYGRSELRGLLVPTCPGCLLRGGDASRVQLSLVPTVYANSINATTGRGFRLQYVSSNVGSEAAAAAFHQADPAMHIRFELQPFAQEYDITVTQLQSFLQFVTNLMSLGAGLAFLCRFLLWLYLRVAHTHAMKLGVSAKGMIETQRQRRRGRAGSRHRQGGSSFSDLSATAVEHSDTESQCSIPDTCVVTATASPFGRWFGGSNASRGSSNASSGRLRSRATGGRGFLGLSRDALGFTKLIEAEVDDDREAMRTPPAARGPPQARNRSTTLLPTLPTSPSRSNASADPATRADAADSAQPAAQRASYQESPSDHCARSDGRRRISARALGGGVHHRSHRRNHTWGGNNSSRHVCNLSELRKSIEQGDPGLVQGAAADAAGARPPVVRKRVASRPSPSAAPAAGHDGAGCDDAACFGGLPAFAMPPPLLTPEDEEQPPFECVGTPQASCWYTSPAPESRNEPRTSAAADDNLGHRAKVHRPARGSPLSSCNSLEALGAAATAAALQKGSVSQPARSPQPLSPTLPSTSFKPPEAIQQGGGATDVAAANVNSVGQATRRSLLTHQLGAITVGSTPPRSASHPASPIREATGCSERPAPNTPVVPADVDAALRPIGLTAAEEAELRALRQREGVEAIRFIEGCPPSGTPAVSEPATPARVALPPDACSGPPASATPLASPAAPVASAARAALTAPAVPVALAAPAALAAPVDHSVQPAPSAVTRDADRASLQLTQQQRGAPPPHRNLQLPSLGTARMLDTMAEMSDEASQSSTPGPSSFTDGVTPSSLGCCTPTFACGSSAPGLLPPPPRTEGFDVPQGGTVGPQRPSSSESGESPRPHSPSDSSVPSSSVNAPIGPRD